MPDDEKTTEIRVSSLRELGLLAMAVGGFRLLMAVVWESLRSPYLLLLFTVAVLIGAWRYLDSGVRLAITPEGIRYAEWGREVFSWDDFEGYAWTTWRGNPYLQFCPHDPSAMKAKFSLGGRIYHFGARMLRMPRFVIGVTLLAISLEDLNDSVERYLLELADQ